MLWGGDAAADEFADCKHGSYARLSMLETKGPGQQNQDLWLLQEVAIVQAACMPDITGEQPRQF